MTTCLRNLLAIVALLIGLLSFSGRAIAEQPAVPRNTVLATNGTLLPAAGFVWVTDKAGDFRVRWVPGLKHATQPNVLAGVKENSWRPAAGFKWVNKDSNDLRVVKAGPSDEELARGVLKALGALALHKASIPQRAVSFDLATEDRGGRKTGHRHTAREDVVNTPLNEQGSLP